jgi:GrpB-like predicted nucleotidyltransferase (UPF0157 family)
MARKVEVVPYRKGWQEQFQAEAQALADVFGGTLVAAHHFGSTAIPGTSAKPIIDLLLVVTDIAVVDSLNARLEALGYTAMGEYGIAGRRFFYKGTYEQRTHHLHIYGMGSPQIRRHLIFRDYMRAHPAPARAYSRLKERLARLYPEDMEQYIAGKDRFVKEQERRAMEWYQAAVVELSQELPVGLAQDLAQDLLEEHLRGPSCKPLPEATPVKKPARRDRGGN